MKTFFSKAEVDTAAFPVLKVYPDHQFDMIIRGKVTGSGVLVFYDDGFDFKINNGPTLRAYYTTNDSLVQIRNFIALNIEAKSAEYILNKLVVDGELFRSSRNGKTNTKAFLDDYACLIYGLLELFEATGEGKWIKQALHFQNQMIQKFWDHGTGGFYSSEENQFFAREKPFYDGAEPSGNSMGAWNLLRISTIMKDESYRDYAKKIFQTFAQILQSNPAYMPQMLTSLDYYLSTAKEVVLVDAHDGRFDALKNVIASNYFPNRVFIQISKDQPHCIDTKIPSLEDKQNVQSSTGFVCEGYICLAPAHDPQAFLNQLNASS